MDRVEKLRNERDSYAVKLMEFTKAYYRNSERLFCFFEEEDEKYYGIRIDNLIPNCDRANIESKGKSNLLRLHDIITNKQEYKSAWLAFFVDRDFDREDELPKSYCLYCTPYYSIENFYISLAVFQQIISTEFKISDVKEDTEKDFQSLCQVFQDSLELFHDAIEELNMWLLEQAKKREQGQQQKLNLNNVKLDRLVHIEINNIQKKYNLSDLITLFPDAIAVDEKELIKKLEWIKTVRNDRWKIFRGKYEIEFLRIFLNNLKEDAFQKKPIFFDKKRKVSCNLSRENIISELSQYADTPDCLRNFLEQLKNSKEKGRYYPTFFYFLLNPNRFDINKFMNSLNA